jgi:hypothetical protein
MLIMSSMIVFPHWVEETDPPRHQNYSTAGGGGVITSGNWRGKLNSLPVLGQQQELIKNLTHARCLVVVGDGGGSIRRTCDWECMEAPHS